MPLNSEQPVDINVSHMARIAESTTKFTLDFFKIAVAHSNGSDNIFFSPFSISAALGMTLAGARGETASQMVSALHLPEDPDVVHTGFEHLLGQLKGNELYVLETANRMYVDENYKLLDTYIELLQKHYLASAQVLKFSDEPKSRATINEWVEEVTRHNIKNLLAPGVLSGSVRVVLVNAIYFKGTWQKTFRKRDTYDQDFHISQTTKIQVPMMHMTKEFRFGYIEDFNARVLELPYKDPRLSMILFLPDAIEGIKDLEANIQKLPLNKLDRILESTRVQVVLPRFKVEIQMNLNSHLQSMGINDLFVENLADLSGVNGAKSLVVSRIVHKAFIEVNEEGSEAAAATAVIMVDSCLRMERPVPRFVADHPFLFFLWDSQTKCVLFAGRMADPSAE